jgi:hypothetical protein
MWEVDAVHCRVHFRRLVEFGGLFQREMHVATRRQQSSFNTANALTRDFLTWLTDAPRTYAEAMDVWRTSCPRLSIWEDALTDDLIRIESAPGRISGQDRVTLTPRGHALLGRFTPAADHSD